MKKRRSAYITDSLIAVLEDLGVRVVFGLPGSQNIDLYESLRRSKIRTVLTTSELAAGFMAIGWYRATGQPGVLVAMEGPGFAWSVAPLAEAAQDASAIIAITGKTPDDAQPYDQGNIGQDRIATALGSAVFNLVDPASVGDIVREAWDDVSKCSPKPVVLQLAANSQSASSQSTEHGLKKPDNTPVDDQAFAEALSALKQAEKPLILAGSGSVEHADILQRLVDEAGIPCIATPSARGVLPESHPLCLTTDLFFADVGHVNRLLEQSDPLLALGCRFARNGTAGFRLALSNQKLIHITRDTLVANSRYRPRLVVEADVGEFLRSALVQSDDSDRSAESGWQAEEIAEWRAAIRSKQQKLPAEPRWVKQGDCIALFQQIRDGIPPDAIVVTDTGLHQLLVRSHFDVLSARGLIFPSDFQSMGFGLPAAIGAALAAGGRKVVVIMGDGSFLMVGAELITAKRENLGLPVLVFCDNSLGIIRHQQVQKFGHEESTNLEVKELGAYATWLGIEYALANEHLTEQIQAAFARTVPTLIEIRLEDSTDFRKIRRKNLIKSSIRSVVGS